MMKKELYAAPATEVLELSLESGVLIGSNTINSTGEQRDGWTDLNDAD